jgi:hypothetical protein
MVDHFVLYFLCYPIYPIYIHMNMCVCCATQSINQSSKRASNQSIKQASERAINQSKYIYIHTQIYICIYIYIQLYTYTGDYRELSR